MSEAAPGNPAIDLVAGVDQLLPEHGPLFAVIGVFDGLHQGHAYLLERLVSHARAFDARPTVITFDSHPDEVLVGAAPPLLLDPAERLERLAEAGVELAVVQHFDDALRRTEYDEFLKRIRRRTRLAGLLMTPEAAFGYERRGTVDAVSKLGARVDPPFRVIVEPSFMVHGRPISSSEIRRRVLAGDLTGAAELLGRPYAVAGTARLDGQVQFPLPVALPPPGVYRCAEATVEVHSDGSISLRDDGHESGGRVRLTFPA